MLMLFAVSSLFNLKKVPAVMDRFFLGNPYAGNNLFDNGALTIQLTITQFQFNKHEAVLTTAGGHESKLY